MFYNMLSTSHTQVNRTWTWTLLLQDKSQTCYHHRLVWPAAPLPGPWHPATLHSWEHIHLDSSLLCSSRLYALPAFHGKILPFFQCQVACHVRWEILLTGYPSSNTREDRADCCLSCCPTVGRLDRQCAHKDSDGWLSQCLSSWLYCGCLTAQTLSQSPFDTCFSAFSDKWHRNAQVCERKPASKEGAQAFLLFLINMAVFSQGKNSTYFLHLRVALYFLASVKTA